MKTLITMILVTLFFATNSYADKKELTIINGGAPGGTYPQLNEALVKDLSPFYNIKVIGESSDSRGYKTFENIKDRPIFVNSRTAFFSGVKVSKGEKPLISDAKKHYIVMGTTYNRAVCAQKGKDVDTLLFGKGGSLKIASSDGIVFGNKFVSKLNAQTNSKHVMVPYNGSGKLVKGLITGDVDIIVVNLGRGIKSMKNGTIGCKYTTSPFAVAGLEPLAPKMKDKWAGFQLTYTLSGEVKNVSPSFAKELNAHLTKILSDPKSNTSKKLNGWSWSYLKLDVDGLRKQWTESFQNTVTILK